MTIPPDSPFSPSRDDGPLSVRFSIEGTIRDMTLPQDFDRLQQQLDQLALLVNSGEGEPSARMIATLTQLVGALSQFSLKLAREQNDTTETLAALVKSS